MCAICGCSPGHAHDHDHGSFTLAPSGVRLELPMETRLLARNDATAAKIRRWLAAQDIVAFNLVSSPGAGKTTLLECTLRDLGAKVSFTVIEGDQETDADALRIRETGCRVVQLNTGTGCHLDAEMVERALQELQPPHGSILMIENVGNLVCPALFDLGERAKVVVASVTEGEDKPLKYPHMFRAAQLVLLNKIDLLPHLRFDVARFLEHLTLVNPQLRAIPVSASSGEGLADWYGWLRGQTTDG